MGTLQNLGQLGRTWPGKVSLPPVIIGAPLWGEMTPSHWTGLFLLLKQQRQHSLIFIESATAIEAVSTLSDAVGLGLLPAVSRPCRIPAA